VISTAWGDRSGRHGHTSTTPWPRAIRIGGPVDFVAMTTWPCQPADSGAAPGFRENDSASWIGGGEGPHMTGDPWRVRVARQAPLTRGFR
jgi:hypothetical protein